MSEVRRSGGRTGYESQEAMCFTTSPDVAKWEQVEEQIRALSRLEVGWCDEGSEPVCIELICSALALASHLRECHQAPDSLYAMPDGNILFEWHLPEQIIRRVEVEGVGHGREMVTFPHDRSQFSDLTWGVPSRWWGVKAWQAWHLEAKTEPVSSADSPLLGTGGDLFEMAA